MLFQAKKVMLLVLFCYSVARLQWSENKCQGLVAATESLVHKQIRNLIWTLAIEVRI